MTALRAALSWRTRFLVYKLETNSSEAAVRRQNCVLDLRKGIDSSLSWTPLTTICSLSFTTSFLVLASFKCYPTFSMASSTLFILLLCSPTLTFGLPSRWTSFPWKRAETPRKVPELGYYNPLESGGSMLTVCPFQRACAAFSEPPEKQIPVTYPMGQGEPVNAIVSGASDAEVLIDAEVGGGLRNYFLYVLAFATFCCGHLLRRT